MNMDFFELQALSQMQASFKNTKEFNGVRVVMVDHVDQYREDFKVTVYGEGEYWDLEITILEGQILISGFEDESVVGSGTIALKYREGEKSCNTVARCLSRIAEEIEFRSN